MNTEELTLEPRCDALAVAVMVALLWEASPEEVPEDLKQWAEERINEARSVFEDESLAPRLISLLRFCVAHSVQYP